MQFTKDSVPGMVDGSITLTFRKWTTTQARAGGRYRTWGILLEVDDVRIVRADEITDAEAQRAGAESAEAVRRRMRVESGDEPIHRIELHYVGADDRIGLRGDDMLSDEQVGDLRTRLDRLDRASKTGPWTRKTLRLIETYPGVVSTALARHLDAERPAFKINVRKLKELGLTESLEIGYRLSPRGQRFLQRDP
jgi:hypothetical protein